MNRLPSLTGLRLPCAAAVFLVHAWLFTGAFADQRIADAALVLGPLGMTGVSCFFIISGFVLAWTARPDDTPARFWRRRAARIYPNHAVVWSATLVLLTLTGAAATGESREGPVPALPALTNLFLVNTWIPAREYNAGVNIVTWSLAAEIFCYALLPFILPALRRLPAHRLTAAAALALAAVWTVPLISLQFHGPPIAEAGDVPQWQFWISYMLPAARLPEFLLGALAALWLRAGHRPPLGVPAAGAATLGCLVTGIALLPFPFLPAAITAAPLTLLVLAAATADLDGRPTRLRHPALVHLGERSFAIYLVHWPVILTVNQLLPPEGRPVPAALAVTALHAACTLAAAWLLHRAVEVPCYRHLASAPHRRPVPRPRQGAPHDGHPTGVLHHPRPAGRVHPPRTPEIPLPEHDGGRTRRHRGPA
ncbi:acyltransferase family protein [Streptomyces carpaticus]|uniref:Acyltransferase family protein n=1 Tax=Streptomyces carpaticus TaxID=285558 RepID=A0ABV4ZQ76_9ACTN